MVHEAHRLVLEARRLAGDELELEFLAAVSELRVCGTSLANATAIIAPLAGVDLGPQKRWDAEFRWGKRLGERDEPEPEAGV